MNTSTVISSMMTSTVNVRLLVNLPEKDLNFLLIK